VSPRVPLDLAYTGVPLRDISTVAWNTSILSRPESRFTLEKAVAPPLRPSISSRSFVHAQTRLVSDPLIQSALYGATPSEIDSPAAIAKLQQLLVPTMPPRGLFAASPANQGTPPAMTIPPIKRLIVDSAKLARLDLLLRELKAGGHRVLLYFQMTKMMDLVEEYLIYRQYKYMRLDGSSAIGDRRDMVTNWQTK
jgi:DNA helicase INO80